MSQTYQGLAKGGPFCPVRASGTQKARTNAETMAPRSVRGTRLGHPRGCVVEANSLCGGQEEGMMRES
jgi:hypothetical protein